MNSSDSQIRIHSARSAGIPSQISTSNMTNGWGPTISPPLSKTATEENGRKNSQQLQLYTNHNRDSSPCTPHIPYPYPQPQTPSDLCNGHEWKKISRSHTIEGNLTKFEDPMGPQKEVLQDAINLQGVQLRKVRKPPDYSQVVSNQDPELLLARTRYVNLYLCLMSSAQRIIVSKTL